MFKSHLFSAYLIIPYIFVSIPILKLNWYPAEMFVGDTFCYFSGMLFAVVGILGHFGKTMLLFFMPQIFNFAISIPQLTRLVPCPRHRLPRYDSSTDLLNYSSFKIKRNDRLISVAIVLLFEKLGLASVQRAEDELIISNFTILNYLVHKHGPMTERNLSMLLVKIQMISSAVALALRFTIFDCA